MTPLLRTLTSEPAAVAAADPPAAPVSDEAVRLALRLRECPRSHGCRLILFVPASPDASAAGIVGDAIGGLLQLNERPVLVMDLRASIAPEIEEARTTPLGFDRPHGLGLDAGLAELIDAPDAPVVVRHPFAGHGDPVRYAASPEFAGVTARVRSSFSYVLLVGGPVASVETLITAGFCDGVVLAVRPGRTTRSDIQKTTDDLRRAHAHVFGFVVDARGTGAKGELSWPKR